MVKLNWNMLGFMYEDGIRNLREMFTNAASGLDRHLRAAYEELDQFDRSVKSGADPRIDRDDDGHVIEDYRDILVYHTTTAEEAKSALNKAIVITLFHHWERSARQWTKRQSGKFTTLCDSVEAIGYPISSRLADFHLLVNLLKHSNPKHGVDLYEKRPEFFRQGFDPAHPPVDWYDEIDVSDEHITEMFAVIAASGPTSSSVFVR